MTTIEKGRARIVLKNVRCGYVHLQTARAFEEGQDPKYDLQVILPKDHPQASEYRKLLTALVKDAFPNFTAKQLRDLGKPLRDGDQEYTDEDVEDDPEKVIYKNAWFFNANSTNRPPVLNPKKEPASDRDHQDYGYSGCYFHVCIDLVPRKRTGNMGISAYLRSVMMYKAGDALGGSRPDPDADFEDIEPEDPTEDGGVDDNEETLW